MVSEHEAVLSLASTPPVALSTASTRSGMGVTLLCEEGSIEAGGGVRHASESASPATSAPAAEASCWLLRRQTAASATAGVVAAVAGVGTSEGCSATPAKSAEPSAAAATDVAPPSTTLPPACAAERLHVSAPAPAPTVAQSVRQAGLAEARSPVKATEAPSAAARGVL